MSWFERIKFYYNEGLWDKQRVWNVVNKEIAKTKVITEEEYEQITGEPYIV